jgi:hypothetical protein
VGKNPDYDTPADELDDDALIYNIEAMVSNCIECGDPDDLTGLHEFLRDRSIPTHDVLEISITHLKYLNRLNKQEFTNLLFFGSVDSYVDSKWELFQSDKLAFLWSCSKDKTLLLANYIDECKKGVNS